MTERTALEKLDRQWAETASSQRRVWDTLSTGQQMNSLEYYMAMQEVAGKLFERLSESEAAYLAAMPDSLEHMIHQWQEAADLEMVRSSALDQCMAKLRQEMAHEEAEGFASEPVMG